MYCLPTCYVLIMLVSSCLGCLKVRGALETIVSALTPIDHARGQKNEVQPALMNTDLLSRESESISLLLSLLVRVPQLKLECSWQLVYGICFILRIAWQFVEFIPCQLEEDFYVRYYTLQLLTALLTNSPNRYFVFGSVLIISGFVYSITWSLGEIICWVFFQVTGSHSNYSSWINSAHGHAHGSWGIKIVFYMLEIDVFLV